MAPRMTKLSASPDTIAALKAEMLRSPAMSMTEAEVDAARRADPDALQPMTGAEIDAAKGEGIRRVRQATGLSQAAFATRYGIPLGTLRDWEQGKSVPDATARTYLRVIQKAPEAVAKALEAA
jgi:putative transcriptional regulator